MKIHVACVVLALGLVGEAKAQTFDKNSTVGSVMVDSADRKRNFLIGLSESFSTKWPKLRVSELTKCLEDAADFPVNWKKEIGPFARDCAIKLYGPLPH